MWLHYIEYKHSPKVLLCDMIGPVIRNVSAPRDARYASLGRCTVVEVFATESIDEDILFNVDSVKKGQTYWDKHYQQA